MSSAPVRAVVGAGRGIGPRAATAPLAVRMGLGLFGCSLLAAMLGGRALYADGASYFVFLLERRQVFVALPSRLAADWLIELPAALALRMGVTDLQVLEWLFGLGCFMPWPVALWLCWRISPRDLWMPLLACSAGYLNAAFHAVGEHSVAHAALWPPLCAVASRRPLRTRDAVIALGCSLVASRAYEAAIVVTIPLAVAFLWRAWRGEDGRASRCLLVAAAGALLAGAPVAVQTIMSPRVAGNAASFVEAIDIVIAAPPWTVTMTALALAVGGAQAGLFRHGRERRGILLGLMLPLILLWGLQPVYAPELLAVHDQHRARFLNLLVPALGLALALPSWLSGTWLRRRRLLLCQLAGLMLAGQSIWHLTATWRWVEFRHQLRGVLASHVGVVDIAQTPIVRRPGMPGSPPMYRPRSLAHLSILSSQGGKVRSLLVAPPHPAYFDVRDPARFPQLARYGIDLGPVFDQPSDAERRSVGVAESAQLR